MNDTLLPDSIAVPHIMAFDLLARQRLSQIQLDALLVYMIDTVNASALYWLAQQFDVLGYKGWKLADTEDKKRSLIKKAIELHRYKGTIWAIKEALRTVGYPDAVITEHVTHWAGFTIQLNAGDTDVNVDQIAEAVAMVNEYKNVRSHLMGLQFNIVFDDSLVLQDDSYEAGGDTYSDSVFTGGDFLYNGLYKYDGTKNYSSDGDVLELTIT